MDIIGVIIAGIIIGLLGKFFAPGDRDNIPLWLTIVCGVGGVIIGYYLAAALGVEATSGIDWIRWIISIVVAATCRDRGLGTGQTRQGSLKSPGTARTTGPWVLGCQRRGRGRCNRGLGRNDPVPLDRHPWPYQPDRAEDRT